MCGLPLLNPNPNQLVERREKRRKQFTARPVSVASSLGGGVDQCQRRLLLDLGHPDLGTGGLLADLRVRL